MRTVFPFSHGMQAAVRGDERSHAVTENPSAREYALQAPVREVRRLAREQPGPIGPADELAALAQPADGRADGRPSRADDLADHAVRERDRHQDAVRADAAPALGEVPEQERDPVLHPVEAGDRVLDGQAAAAGDHTLEQDGPEDRKSTRLNSSHANISYAVFCLKKKKQNIYPYIYTRKTNKQKKT